MSTFITHIPFVEMLGMELVSFDAGRSEITLVLREELTNSLGMAHGGVSMTLLDVAMAHAARSPNQPGADGGADRGGSESRGVVTIEMKTTFLRPGVGRLRALGQVLHRTGSMAFCEGRILADDGRVVAHATGSFKYIRPHERRVGPVQRLDASE